ncbi:cell division protease FtsH [Mycoplasmoides fastidiosum]|uniref:ATP-dependent zinc metalloprotease FtsH n=1 Tax=Mycoplasmoides fastidiosum TaxID=92758 RepID=A0ABU0LYN4_9BACT|nr:ATP-dependent zinc metalloprotease FtsH [Mycoplasmoides fastidiosum]MDQ0513798.1 cell division protease FtsH [Mycoplasmoides fastidiosum]UUD37784.1 ATP-dependent zinc metalloprotease FtsH [Mycoplasmoides fastidiosum]
MFKLAKWLGLIDSRYKKSVWSRIKSKFRPKNSSDSQAQSDSHPKGRFRWKPIIIVFIIGTIIGLLIYFLGFYGRVQVIGVHSFDVARENNQTILVLKNNNNTENRINLTTTPNPQADLSADSPLQRIQIKGSSNSQNIAYNVGYGSDAKTVWYEIGSDRLIYNVDTGSFSISRPGEQLIEISNTSVPSSQSLLDLYNYLNLAKSNSSIPSPSFLQSVIVSTIPILIYLIIVIFLIRLFMRAQAGAAGQDSIFGVGKSNAKTVKLNITFKDVAGIKEEKEELMEIVDYLKNPGKYTAMGARTPKGIVLYGPPGTGKTLLAKAVSGEANVPFFEVSGASFDDMFVGVGAKRVRDLFNRAKKAAPCIIFIDEIDAVAGKRGNKMINGGSGGLADQTINQLLSELDGFNTSSGVVVIAATNRLDSLDDAILRPGRFDRHIQVNLPDIKEREEILKIHSRNKNLSSKVNLEDIARRTPGFSGAQLENVLNEATLLAVRYDRHSISTQDIDEAIDRVIAGPAKKSRIITLSERRKIAYHEAGHAIAGLYTQKGDVVEKITIIPRGQAGGYTLSAPVEQEVMLKSREDLLAIITTTLAGRAAEEVVFGPKEITSGASNDLYKVSNIVRAMVTQLGMSKLGLTQYVPSEGEQNPYVKNYSDVTAKAIDDEINLIINQQYEIAKKIIIENKEELKLIVECLLLLETIVREQINYIHKYKKLPQEALKAKERLAKERLVKEESKEKVDQENQ